MTVHNQKPVGLKGEFLIGYSLVSNRLGEIYKEAHDRIVELETQIDNGADLISGFYEELVPSFRQGAPKHELESLVTAEEVTGYVARIEQQREQLNRVNKMIGSYGNGLFNNDIKVSKAATADMINYLFDLAEGKEG